MGTMRLSHLSSVYIQVLMLYVRMMEQDFLYTFMGDGNITKHRRSRDPPIIYDLSLLVTGIP